MQIKTISTVAGVNEIDFGNDDSQSTAHFYWFKNLSDSTLYVSAKSNPVAGEDNVAELSVKGAASIETDEGKVYVLGAGKVEIHRTNSKFCPFELPSTGSGGGSSITIDSELSETSTNPAENRAITGAINDINEKIELHGGLIDRMLNPNLLFNPDFKINQRGISGEFTETGKYFVDRWKLVSGTVTINDNGTITLNGVIRQEFEPCLINYDTVNTYVGSVSAGVISITNALYQGYRRYVSDVTITGTNDTIEWAKLEPSNGRNDSSPATPFITPNPIDELAKCQRYYVRNAIARKPFGCGYAVNSSTANIFIPMNPLRSNIAEDRIYFDNLALVGYGHTTNSESAIVTQVTNVAMLYNGVSLQLVSSDLTQGHTYMPYLKDGGSIIFDAEIS